MGHRINPSWWTHSAISWFTNAPHCSKDWYVLSCLWVVHINTESVAHEVVAAGFFSHCLSGPLRYVWYHITINKNVLNALLNKTFPFFPSLHTKIYLSRKKTKSKSLQTLEQLKKHRYPVFYNLKKNVYIIFNSTCVCHATAKQIFMLECH